MFSKPDVLKDNSKPNEESVAACLSKYVSKTEVSGKGDRHSLGMAYVEVNTMFKKMPVVSGRLMPGNKPVSVLRDTGCSTCVVKASLVTESQMTDKLHSVLQGCAGIFCRVTQGRSRKLYLVTHRNPMVGYARLKLREPMATYGNPQI